VSLHVQLPTAVRQRQAGQLPKANPEINAMAMAVAEMRLQAGYRGLYVFVDPGALGRMPAAQADFGDVHFHHLFAVSVPLPAWKWLWLGRSLLFSMVSIGRDDFLGLAVLGLDPRTHELLVQPLF